MSKSRRLARKELDDPQFIADAEEALAEIMRNGAESRARNRRARFHSLLGMIGVVVGVAATILLVIIWIILDQNDQLDLLIYLTLIVGLVSSIDATFANFLLFNDARELGRAQRQNPAGRTRIP
jgi:hypothetical protein